MARLASGVLVKAMLRRVNLEGGTGAVLARGDETAGGILVIAVERGEGPRFFERGLGPQGQPALIPSGPKEPGDAGEAAAYWQRRRERDSDLWVVELDLADAERIAGEVLVG